jgi:muramoyltetrapeptide carboxypeptidase
MTDFFVTALQVGLLKKAGIVGCTGFVFSDLEDGLPDPLIERTLFACLKNESFEITQGQTMQPGLAKGTLVGGNLDCLIALMGTPYQANVQDSILVIEDVGAEPFQIDSRLSQLDLAGVFDQVEGVIFGKFSRCKANYFPTRDGSVEDVIDEWASRIKVPCIKDFPYGHISSRCVLPLGRMVSLNATQVTLTISNT